MNGPEILTDLLHSLSALSSDIESVAIVDDDGLVMASSMPSETDEEAVAAISAATLGMSERVIDELKRGELELCMVRSSGGFLILSRCGREAALVVLASAKARIGLLFMDIKRIAARLRSHLDGEAAS